jgi:hypothetical protein
MYAERRLEDPALQVPLHALQRVLQAHEPCPALAVDRHWHMVAHNRIVPLLLAGLPDALLAPPINVMRLSLHPQGLSTRIVNLAHWRGHLMHRLQLQAQRQADAALQALIDELQQYPAAAQDAGQEAGHDAEVYVPLQLRSPVGLLSFISTITVFGTPNDVTLSELALETFFPADEATAQALRQLAGTLR